MNTKDVLIAARKLIEKPENWTRRAWARDAFGKVVGSHDNTAVCWCAEGAIRRASDDYWVKRDAEKALSIAFGGTIYSNPAEFNDVLPHAEVLAAFDKAIAEFAS